MSGTKVKVSSPEALIAAKLSGSFKNKDIEDILNLCEALGDRIGEKKILKILTLLGKEDHMKKYRSLVD